MKIKDSLLCQNWSRRSPIFRHAGPVHGGWKAYPIDIISHLEVLFDKKEGNIVLKLSPQKVFTSRQSWILWMYQDFVNVPFLDSKWLISILQIPITTSDNKSVQVLSPERKDSFKFIYGQGLNTKYINQKLTRLWLRMLGQCLCQWVSLRQDGCSSQNLPSRPPDTSMATLRFERLQCQVPYWCRQRGELLARASITPIELK